MLRSAATTTTGARPRSATFEVAWKAMSSRKTVKTRSRCTIARAMSVTVPLTMKKTTAATTTPRKSLGCENNIGPE